MQQNPRFQLFIPNQQLRCRCSRNLPSEIDCGKEGSIDILYSNQSGIRFESGLPFFPDSNI